MIANEPTAAAEFRETAGRLASPVVVYNKSHSGSRLLARLLAEAGVFMGAHTNESNDSLDAVDLVEHLVREFHPDYSRLWADGPEAEDVARRARVFLERHLEGGPRTAEAPWGWKLCESGYALPALAWLFPRMRAIHLVRDGRDVAFCDHRGPDNPFWKKIYFDTDRIGTWRGLRLTGPSYRRRTHLFNALHWTNAVRVGRAYGSMLGERYLEVRYEDLCGDFAPTARRVLRFAGVPAAESAIARIAPEVGAGSIGKYRAQPARRLRDVVAIEKAQLLSFGYLDEEPEPPSRRPWNARFADEALDRRRKARTAGPRS
ncbi:MAG: sulfotransferase [Deltaproteobacteria bacterium]